jgi:prolyl 4-hydroxylase
MQTYNSIRDIPMLSPLGFQKMQAPKPLFDKILNAYALLKQNEQKEQFEGMDKFIPNTANQHAAFLMSMDQYADKRDEILRDFHPIFTNWVHVPIKPLFLYGIRSYKHGSSLAPHVDRLQTHHVSAIVCVDKQVNDDWALDICDHSGAWHQVYLNPGDIVLYESAICQHARFKPLNGAFYNNLFVHYSLA